MEITKSKEDRKITGLQYFNTVLLTIISITLAILLGVVAEVRHNQEMTSIEIAKQKVTQEMNVTRITKLEDRTANLEKYNESTIKDWVEQNFVRRPQK